MAAYFCLHEKREKWAELTTAMETLSSHVKALKPDAIVIYSTQWFSVLGTSFQTRAHVSGLHVDEKLDYEWGNRPI